MHRFKIILFIMICCCQGRLMAANSVASIVPGHLTCAYLTDPIGIDDLTPKLGWQLRATDKSRYGQRQTAYRILVDQDSVALSQRRADVWDSGWVESDATQHIVYLGKKLHPDRKYYWCVAVKDEKGKMSDFSPIGKWVTGLFSNADWTADWIGTSEVFDASQTDYNVYDPWFRKNIYLEEQPSDARIFVASIGFHELYVNGQKIGNPVLAPAATDHGKRARYIGYDISKALRKGSNTISFWLGAGWSIYAPYVRDDRPRGAMVRAEASLYNASREVIGVIKTDGSWKTHPSPNKLLGNWSPRNFGGEVYDANLEVPNWNQPSYDDRSWKRATVYYPHVQLSAQQVEGNVLFREINPVAIEALPNGDYRVDMGVNFAGWTQINVKGAPEKRIDFLFSERRQDEMTFNNRSAYIVDASGVGTFKNRFNYSSGRWITIKGAESKPSLQDIKGWAIRTGYAPASSFVCSDSLQNWIYDRTLWTFDNLSLGGMIVDCPQRERMGYGGDAHATTETGMLNYKMASFYAKWMEDWQDVQGTEPMVGNMNDPQWARKKTSSGRVFNTGILPHTAPTYWGGGGPAWGGIVVTLPWSYYQQYGDKQILEDNFDLIKGWLNFLEGHVQDDLLKPYGGDWDFLGDWLWPNATAEGMNNKKPENICFNNLYRVYNLRTAALIAHEIGNEEQAEIWLAQAEKTSTAINAHFYKNYSYADGSMSNQSLALLAEVVPAEDIKKVQQQLEYEILVKRKGHIHAGITGGALLFKYLRSIHRNDLIYSMLKQTAYPSWGYMRDNDATTIWEMWEKDLRGHSLLHSSFLYPGAWYIDGLSGIKSSSPGYKTFDIQIPKATDTDIAWAKTDFISPMGPIKSHWTRQDGTLTLDIAVPPNTTALLKIPKEDGTLVLQQKAKVRTLPAQAEYSIIVLEPGKYVFKNIN
ncbi:family 78 glycoside hydrolase catalytic domain [Sphingobacterium paucimobilis]|nr:family 78 glycoside hydrolase catalytic domain [Sphingobacterium paucimobilis]